jgi:biotin transport system substrate-specific component
MTSSFVPGLLQQYFVGHGGQAAGGNSAYGRQNLAVRVASELLVLLLGVALVSALAQVVIRLPWTPVPITGQTFGVAVMALLWGRKRAFGVMSSYLALSIFGAPILAGGAAFLTFGATSGYLLGMLVSACVVGELADRGYTRTWARAFVAASLGSVCVFGFGLLVLSFFLPEVGVAGDTFGGGAAGAAGGLFGGLVSTKFATLLTAGFLPFLPGDILKNSLAALIASRLNKTRE